MMTYLEVSRDGLSVQADKYGDRNSESKNLELTPKARAQATILKGKLGCRAI
jgi:hypothetical protein